METNLFNLPPLRDATPQDKIPSLKGLDQWLDGLPMADTGQLSRRLYATLNSLREVSMEESERLAILEALREPLGVLQKGLAPRIHRQALPVPEKVLKVFHLSSALYQAMAQGYLRVLAAPQKRQWLFQRRQQEMRALSAQRAMAGFGGILENYRHFHLPAPRGLWRLMHACLRRSRELEVMTIHAGVEGKPEPTPLNEYISQVLLAQIPYQQLSAQQLDTLHAQVHRWADGGQLMKGSNGRDEGGLYLHLGQDLPPLQAAGHPPPAPGSESESLFYFLDLAPLLQRLEEGETGLDALLRPLLLRHWRGNLGREQRHAAEGRQQLIYGMSAIYQHLRATEEALLKSAEEKDEETAKPPQSSNFAIEGLITDMHEERLENVDVWDQAYIKSQKSHWSERFAQQESLPPQETELKNRSAGGICLHLVSDRHSLFRTGELVAIEDEEQLRIGALRWVRADKQSVELGVQWLAAEPQPVFVHIGAPEKGTKQQALLAFNGPQGLLLVPNLPGLENKRLWLDYGGRSRLVSSREPSSQSNFFLAYNIDLVEESIEGIKSAADDDMDSLWREL